MSSQEKLTEIKQYLHDVETCESLGIGEEGFADEAIEMIQKYSQLVRAESINDLLSNNLIAHA